MESNKWKQVIETVLQELLVDTKRLIEPKALSVLDLSSYSDQELNVAVVVDVSEFDCQLASVLPVLSVGKQFGFELIDFSFHNVTDYFLFALKNFLFGQKNFLRA
ncbi:MAG: hypothetical protein J5965_06730 [Aeriscardovia sp.]|nr:hypothetical protein [Aeriscardovia sp.]